MTIDWLVKADKHLFFVINKQLSCQPLDNIMLLMRQPFTWIPVYLFFLLFFFSNCRKYIVPILILSMLTFALTDFTSASIIKPLVHRLRPCYDTSLHFQVNNLAGCGGLFSMPSSHASNHFGLSSFWFFVIRHSLSRKWYLLWFWALSIGYAQIYVGVHFPGDIAAGALLGALIGYFAFSLYKKWIPLFDHPATDILQP